MTRRQTLLLVWEGSMIFVGLFVFFETESLYLAFAAPLSLLSISVGVPLMRAYTEHSK